MIFLNYMVLVIGLLFEAQANFTDLYNDICFICTCDPDEGSIDCSQKGLTDLPDGFIPGVRTLNLSNNEITQFPINLARFYDLVTLDLSGNGLNKLPSDALQNLTKLELFNLSKNNFITWLNLNPNEVLEPATSLKTLDLSHNKFTTLENLANQELFISSSLETLILDHCKIISVYGRSPVSGLNNLRVLKLNSNPLLRIQNLVAPNLRSLHISNCQLTRLTHNELSFLPSLTYLKLSHNNRLELSENNLYSDSLKYLDVSYCNIMEPHLQGFPNLRKVLIDHNVIRTLKSNEFVNSTKLEYLDLSYNNIGSLKVDIFRGLESLKYLDLSWNEIAAVPENSLLEMPLLTQVKFSRNYLTRVGHLKSLSVKVLDMSLCEISSIGKDSLEGLPSLIDINLSRNLLSSIPDSISSNTLQYLNLNYNRISSVSNYTFFMLPRLLALSVVGNRFTTIWNKAYFASNPYLDRIDLTDNMWRCECNNENMVDFYEFVTLEPNKKEESYNLICNSPSEIAGQTWLEACYFTWNPSAKASSPDTLIWFIICMIVGLCVCFTIVQIIKRSMKRRLEFIQAERERQVEETRDRLRQLRIRAEQEALITTPDPRDLVAPPSYDEALTMPKLNASCHSLCEAGTGKTKRKRGRRKTKSSGDLLEETERNGDLPVVDDLELTETSRRRTRRRPTMYGSHEIANLERSPGARRRRGSEFDDPESITVEVQADLERPQETRALRLSPDNNSRESEF